MSAQAKARASTKPRNTVMLQVVDIGGRRAFVAADQFSSAKLRKRALPIGTQVSAEIRVPRDPVQWRKAHALGQFLIDNTDEFGNYEDAHDVLKRLQLEADIECDSIAIRSDFGLLEHRVPKSMAFELMDQLTFDRVYAQFCKHIEAKYMPGVDQMMLHDLEKLMGRAA